MKGDTSMNVPETDTGDDGITSAGDSAAKDSARVPKDTALLVATKSGTEQ